MSDMSQPPSHPNPGIPQAAQTAKAGKGRGPMILALAAVLAFVVMGVAVFAALIFFGGDEAEAVTLRPFGEAGPDAFTDSIAPAPTATLSDFAQRGATEETVAAVGSVGRAGTYRQAAGTVTGVFGGSLNETACNPNQLVSFLTADASRAEVWASVLSIDAASIVPYVDSLTAVNLAFDTRVLDHGLSDGAALPREVVLQRGTAVLIDARGVPRVNCYSGNPLLDPTIAASESYEGDQWASFTSITIIVIAPAPVDAAEFMLADIETGEVFARPAGTAGEADAGSAAASDEGEATTDVAAAGPIELDTLIMAQIAEGQSEIRYEINPPGGTTLNFTVNNQRDSIGRMAFALESSGDQITFFRVPPAGSETFSYTLGADDGGTFELVFTEGPAEFDFIVESVPQNDAAQGIDAGAEFASAVAIASGQQIDGAIADLDEADRYLIDLSGAPALTLRREVPRDSPARAAFTVILAGEQIDFARVNPGASDEFTILFGPDDVGMLEILVSEGPSTYSFVAEFNEQDDGGQPGDASAELADARTLDTLTDVSGEVGQRDRGDHYLFEAPAAEMSIDVTVDAAASGRIGVAVVGADGGQLTFFRVEPGVTTTETFSAEPGDVLRLLVTEGRANYSLSIS